MNHQARELLSLVQNQAASTVSAANGAATLSKCRSLVISSGAGGVGRSLIALQTALSLGQQGVRVALLDANAGISHTALLAGLSDWTSLDRLPTDGRLDDVAISLSESVALLCGVAEPLTDQCSSVMATQLDEWLDQFEWCVIDAGLRTQPGVERLLLEADIPTLVTTPEPVSLAETYAALRALNAAGRHDVSIVLNRAASYDVGHRVEKMLVDTTAEFINQRTSVSATILDELPVTTATRARRVGRFLDGTQFGRSVSSWTARLNRAA